MFSDLIMCLGYTLTREKPSEGGVYFFVGGGFEVMYLIDVKILL